jgi:hypothetical protein
MIAAAQEAIRSEHQERTDGKPVLGRRVRDVARQFT